MLVVLGANLLGDWLRDIFDPKLRGRQDESINQFLQQGRTRLTSYRPF